MAHRKLKLLALCASVGTALLAASSASAWTVELTAQPALERTHTWKIEKKASTSAVTLKKGESTTVSYSVTVSPAAAPVDGAFSVSGTLAMSEDPDITINSVVFRIEPELIVASYSCMPTTFPVELGIEGLDCTYSAPLPDAGPRTTWMRATRVGGFRNARAAIDFGSATVNEVDECVEVTDSMAGALGTVCAADAPKTFTYSKTIGPFGECGAETVDNVAAFEGKDSGAAGSASAAVAVTVTGCEPPKNGCVRTIGYWKNHAGFGPQADVVSPLLPIWLGTPAGAKSLNVTTAAKAVSLLKMEGSNGVHSARNGINKLYAQLLAAKLNGKSNADLTPVAGVIAASDTFLASNDSLDWGGLAMLQRAAVLVWMAKLDAYNNGKYGPAHCADRDEDECKNDKHTSSRDGDDCDDDRGDDECREDKGEGKGKSSPYGKGGSYGKGGGGCDDDGGHHGGGDDDDDDHGHGGGGRDDDDDKCRDGKDRSKRGGR